MHGTTSPSLASQLPSNRPAPEWFEFVRIRQIVLLMSGSLASSKTMKWACLTGGPSRTVLVGCHRNGIYTIRYREDEIVGTVAHSVRTVTNISEVSRAPFESTRK